MALLTKVSVDFYLSHTLPGLPDSLNLDDILTTLQEDGAISEDGEWSALAEELHDEVEVLKRLHGVFDAVMDAAKRQENLCDLKQISTMILTEDLEPDEPRLYFCLGKCQTNDNYEWFKSVNPIYVVGLEHDDDGYEAEDPNDCAVVKALEDIMSDDPCRRFAFGTTIQGRNVTLWYANRAVIFKSEPFDLLTNHRYLIHLFLALAFAPSKVNLGWDPSITRLRWENEEWVYEIQVDGQTYIASSLLADYSSGNIAGRATRVWLTEDCHGNVQVLKDVWIEVARQPEHEIRQRMLNDVLQKCGQEDHDTLKRHLLTPAAFEKVCIDDRLDSTDLMVPADSESFEGVRIRHRFHYRVVFAEYASTITDQRSLSKIFATLADALKALSIIHRAGWVHRDISGGNIYSYSEADGTHRGLIGDFEHAINDGTVESPVRLVGTADTIACEAILHIWLFRLRDERNKAYPKVPFKPVFLHDLESLWWILVHILFFYDDADNVICDSKALDLRENVKETLFPGKVKVFKDIDTTGFRRAFIKNPTVFRGKDGLSRSLWPVRDVVAEIASVLVDHYKEAEKPDKLPVHAKDFSIHRQCGVFLDEGYRTPIAHIRLIRTDRIGACTTYGEENVPSSVEPADLIVGPRSLSENNQRSEKY